MICAIILQYFVYRSISYLFENQITNENSCKAVKMNYSVQYRSKQERPLF